MKNPGQPAADADMCDPEDLGVNESTAPDIQTLISRRLVLAGAGAIAAAAVFEAGEAGAQVPRGASTLRFKDVKHGLDGTHHVAEGYRAQVLLRWGDPIAKDASDFVPGKVDGAAQEKQFGYNCDFLAYWPLPYGSRNLSNGPICG